MNYIDTQDLKKYTIQALDGKIGSVSDFYFDEDLFYLRYIVVDTEPFLLRNLVLVSPISFSNVNPAEETIELSITKKELEDSPGLDSNRVVSRQYEKAYNDHFSWPYYWGGYGYSAWTVGPYGINRGYNNQLERSNDDIKDKNYLIKDAQNNGLRSLREVRSYSIKGIENEEFGHIEGFILDPNSLSIDFVLIDTINYFPSKNVLLRPEWIENISWETKTVTVQFPRELIKSAPSYKHGELDEKSISESDKHFSQKLNEDFQEKPYQKNLSFFNVRNNREKLKEVKME